MSKAPTLADELAESADKLAGDLRAALAREKKLVMMLRVARAEIVRLHDKSQETDSGKAVLAHISDVLAGVSPQVDAR